MPEHYDQVGIDKTYKTPSEAYEAAYGKYKDNAEGMSPDQAFPNAKPAAADPNPFKISGS